MNLSIIAPIYNTEKFIDRCILKPLHKAEISYNEKIPEINRGDGRC